MSGTPLQKQSPGSVLVWILAARLKTLPAAVAPVLLGCAIARGLGPVSWGLAFIVLLCAALIQVGTNLANDVFDFEKGADGPERLGPARAVQSGWLSPTQVRRAMILVFLLATALGTLLVFHGGWPILIIGIAGILSGIAYTGGPWPLGYHGLGDLFVFVFFGPVAVGGTVFLLAQRVEASVLLAGSALGLLATAILVVNNLRDRKTDEKVGKRTLAVRMGGPATRVYYCVLLLGAYALVPLATPHPLAGLVLLSLPLAFFQARVIWKEREPSRLNAALAGTAQLLLLFSLTWIPVWIQSAFS